MSAGGTPAVLFYLLDRHALLAMTNGSKCVFLNSLTTPVAQSATPPRPVGGGHRGAFIPLRRPVRIHMTRCCRCMLYSRARTLYTNRRGWTQGNWLPCQLMCGPMGMRRLLWLCNP